MKFRTLAKITGCLLALILLALLSLPLFISADFLKAQLIAQVKKATGRELVVKGNTSLVLFPKIAVSAEDVTLGNPPGFRGPYFLHLAKLQAGAALQPLLQKQLDITGITLDGMEMNLEENAEGVKNWEFTTTKEASETQAKPSQAPTQASQKGRNLKVGEVSVKQSSIRYIRPGAKQVLVENIDLSLTGADGREPLKLKTTLSYQKQPLTLTLSAGSLNAMQQGKPTQIDMALTLPFGTHLSFKGKAGLAAPLMADGPLSLTSDNFPGLLAWAMAKPAASSLPKHVKIESVFSTADFKTVSFANLAMQADAMSGKGKLSVDLHKAVPAFNGALQIAELNLDHFQTTQAAGKSVSAAPTATHVEGWSSAPIDVSALGAVDANLGLSVGHLQSGNLQASDLVLKLQLQNRNAKLDLAKATLYNGTAQGEVRIDATSPAFGLAVNLALDSIQIEPLATALSGTSHFDGRTNLTLALTGHGPSERAIVGSLNGKGSLAIRDGAIKGINIAQFLRRAKQGYLSGQNTTEKTDFSALTGSFTLAQGILTNKDLALQSPILRGTGSGTVNLPGRSLAYRLVATVVGSLQGQGAEGVAAGLAFPLDITGPWQNPNVKPDIGSVIHQSIQNPTALKQSFKDIKSQIKNFNSPKDLGRALFHGTAKEAPHIGLTPAPASSPASTPAVSP